MYMFGAWQSQPRALNDKFKGSIFWVMGGSVSYFIGGNNVSGLLAFCQGKRSWCQWWQHPWYPWPVHVANVKSGPDREIRDSYGSGGRYPPRFRWQYLVQSAVELDQVSMSF
jgi:hypothetical protein